MTDSSIVFDPLGRRVSCPAGTSLLEAARQAGVPMVSVCGGKGICGKCAVKASGRLGPLTAPEVEHLSTADIAAGYRLACQARVEGPAVAQVSLIDTVVYKAALPMPGEGYELKPNVRKVYLHLPPPSLGDQRADLERLRAAMGVPFSVDLRALRSLPTVLRQAEWGVTAVLVGGRLVAVESGDTAAQAHGIAFDVGTTTVAAYLLDLNDGRQLAAAAATNRQTVYGDDVISRLDHAHAGGLAELQQAARETLNLLAEEVCRAAGVSAQNLYEAVVVGNTCMVHLLLGVDPHPIGVAPYVPVLGEAVDLPARAVGLAIAAGANVHILPAVAGYVGADAVADALVAALREPGKVRLIMDVGTNAEMVLDNRGQLLACAAAAGPAFEGARISCGMRAAPGAIDRVGIAGGRVAVHTLEERPALGLAGSGLVSVAVALRRSGLLTARGRFLVEAAQDLFVQGEGGLEFLLVPAAASGTGRAIGLSQQDIAELLLAKAAIAAGLKIMLQEAGLTVDDVDEVLIAGSFGNFLDKEEAMDIGLVPRLPAERVVGIGNAAGAGAIAALLSLERRRQAQEIARTLKYVELSAHPEFSQEFVRGMSFPEIELTTDG